MAVRLGNFGVNKSINEISNTISIESKKQKLFVLIKMAQVQVELAKDIYDTYFHIKQVDESFAKQLWKLLCKRDIEGIDINSYFSWTIGCGGNVYISRFGVSFYGCRYKEKLLEWFEVDDEKELYRGRIMLFDVVSEFELTENELDKFIEELEILIKHFSTYADRFFKSVSSYKVTL